MATLKELKAENTRLKQQMVSRQSLLDAKNKRNELLKENRILLRRMKYGASMKVGKAVGKASLKVGKTIGKGLFVMAQKIAEAERREEMARMKAMRSQRKKNHQKRGRPLKERNNK